jgi:hypothetical protein
VWYLHNLQRDSAPVNGQAVQVALSGRHRRRERRADLREVCVVVPAPVVHPWLAIAPGTAVEAGEAIRGDIVEAGALIL